MDRSRKIVITGVSQGLGQALTRQFIAMGHRVAGCARNASSIEQLQERYPEDCFSIVDVADDSEVRSWANEVLGGFGTPDLLLNNAAVINRNAPLWKVPAGELGRIIDINIKGVANVIRHFLPAMIEAGTGVVVNFSSGWGRSAAPEVAPYCATKWAIEGLTRALADELPDGLTAVPLNPGVINTGMLQSCFGTGAGSFQGATEWAERAAPFILQIGADANGEPLTVG